MAVDVSGAEAMKAPPTSREFRGYGLWSESEILDSPPPRYDFFELTRNMMIEAIQRERKIMDSNVTEYEGRRVDTDMLALAIKKIGDAPASIVIPDPTRTVRNTPTAGDVAELTRLFEALGVLVGKAKDRHQAAREREATI